LFNKFIPTPPKSTDNPNINLMDFGDRLFALTEATFISEVKPDSLSVKDKTDLKDYLPLHLSTAHPHKLKDGTMIFFGTNMNYKNAYNFIEIPPPADPSENPFAAAKIVATVPSRWKMNISYTHSFGLTENYFVHLEQPLTANLPLVFFQKPLGKRFADVLTVHEGQSMDIMLVDRATGKRHPITYEAPEGMAFHFINSYEEADHVVCDICFKPKGALAVYHAYLHIMAEDLKKRESDNEPSYFARFVLPLSIEGAEAGKNLVTLPNTTATATLREGSKTVVSVTPEIIKDGMTADFPGINYSYNGMKYRYCYTCTALATINRNLAKFDLVEKRVLTYDVGDDHQVGEPVFLARPGATREDDGVVLSTMIAFNSSVQSYLVILDAITFTEIARASLPSEMKMTFTFHGMFSDKIL
ncbi:retinoid isomerohydrolase, partial [Plakobranchus ocellatus]